MEYVTVNPPTRPKKLLTQIGMFPGHLFAGKISDLPLSGLFNFSID